MVILEADGLQTNVISAATLTCQSQNLVSTSLNLSCFVSTVQAASEGVKVCVWGEYILGTLWSS